MNQLACWAARLIILRPITPISESSPSRRPESALPGADHEGQEVCFRSWRGL